MVITCLQLLVHRGFLGSLVPGSFVKQDFQGERNDACRSLADIELELWNTVRGIRTTGTVDCFTAQIHLGHECWIEAGKVQLSNMIMNPDIRLVDESPAIGDNQFSTVLQFFRLILVPWNEDVSLDSVV